MYAQAIVNISSKIGSLQVGRADDLLPLLDTHQHLIYRERYPYRWTEEIPHLAGRAFRYDDYLAAAAGCGITATVFMETLTTDPVDHDETAFVEGLASIPGSLIGGIVAVCRPESAAFPEWLDSLHEPRVVGLRRILHVEPDDLSRHSQFREHLRLLPEHGLTFDLCVLARQLPLALDLVTACPDVAFVLDHCGVPDIAAGAIDPWRDNLRAMANCVNVTCKISGLLAYCDPLDATTDAVRPYVEHAIEVFGWERVIWGSDWPVVEITATLRDWAGITRRIVAGESEANRRKLFTENGKRVYRLAQIAGTVPQASSSPT
jgi:predicted TIM-barrel fold metal-dependent hydrolase